MPDEARLPAGPRRDLIAAVHELYSAAGKPPVRLISTWIREGNDLPGTLSHEAVSSVLKGTVPRWANLESLVYVLAEHRRVRQSDPVEVVERILELWNIYSDQSSEAIPALTTSAPNVTGQTAPEVSPAASTGCDVAPTSEGDPPAAATLDETEAELIAAQYREHGEELEVYQRILTSKALREDLIAALRRATEEEHISKHGMRVSVWSTDLHYRFVVSMSPGEQQLFVQLEETGGRLISSNEWKPGEAPREFFERLRAAVCAAGRDLGVGLNVPTESVRRLSETIVEIAKLRAQEPWGYRYRVWKVVQKEDFLSEWYFTETALIPADDPTYEVEYDRLDELDWEEHLRDNKGWRGAELALRFARMVHASLTA